jgi:hypothetical protein
MRFPVVADDELRQAECRFAQAADLPPIQQWRQTITGRPEQVLHEASEIGELACKWWLYFRRTGVFADNRSELLAAVQRDPKAEVSMMLVAKAPWFMPSEVLGACHFRRTWTGQITVDFVAVHPLAMGRSPHAVSEVGRGLLYQVARLAQEVGAPRLWGECTPGSQGFYRALFPDSEVTDLFLVNRTEYLAFLEACQERWERLRDRYQPQAPLTAPAALVLVSA